MDPFSAPLRNQIAKSFGFKCAPGGAATSLQVSKVSHHRGKNPHHRNTEALFARTQFSEGNFFHSFKNVFPIEIDNPKIPLQTAVERRLLDTCQGFRYLSPFFRKQELQRRFSVSKLLNEFIGHFICWLWKMLCFTSSFMEVGVMNHTIQFHYNRCFS